MNKKLYFLLLFISPLSLHCSAFYDVDFPAEESPAEREATRIFQSFTAAIRRDDIDTVLNGFKNKTLNKEIDLYFHVRSLKMAQFLYDQGVPINDEYKNKSFLVHFFKDNNDATIHDICTFFLSKDPTLLEERSYRGETSLFIACFKGQTDIVRCLLKLGAQVQVKDFDGNSPLHKTAYEVKLINDDSRKERLECARLLLAHNRQQKEEIKK